MRFVLHLIAAMAVALAVGFSLSWFTLADGRFFGTLEIGPWTARPALGASAPDPYARAALARTGGLQLGQSEGLKFTASTDSSGRPLDRACRYRIAGTTPVASFWTLVATDVDGINIARTGTQLALNSARLARADDGTAVIYVSRSLAPYNWLEISGSGAFTLSLSFYDVSSLSGVAAEVEALPAILREACP